MATAALSFLMLGTVAAGCDEAPGGPEGSQAPDGGASSTGSQAEPGPDGVELSRSALSLAGRTGYVVKVRTCPDANAGTTAPISLSLTGRDANWNIRQVGGASWPLDLGDANRPTDSEQLYFFEEALPLYHLEGMYLAAGGAGGDSWCWTLLAFTRIQAGVTGWTWVYHGPHWISPGQTGGPYAFLSGHNGEYIPPDVSMPNPPAPQDPRVTELYSTVIRGTFSYGDYSQIWRFQPFLDGVERPNGGSSGGSFEFSPNVLPSTTYRLTVKAQGWNGRWSAPSPELIVTTPPMPPPPPSPTDATVTVNFTDVISSFYNCPLGHNPPSPPAVAITEPGNGLADRVALLKSNVVSLDGRLRTCTYNTVYTRVPNGQHRYNAYTFGRLAGSKVVNVQGMPVDLWIALGDQ